MKPQSPLDYVRSGQTPMFRLPLSVPSMGEAPDYDGATCVFMGIPYDAGTTHRPGARFAPYQIRRMSAAVTGYHPVHGIDVFERVPAVDGGNIPVTPFAAEVMRDTVEILAGQVHDQGAAPLIIGGDHSITLPLLRAAKKAHGELAVVHVDAHFDTSDATTWGEGFHHGTPIRHALEEGLIARGQLFQVGIRGPWKDSREADVARAHDARLYNMQVVDDRGIRPVVEEIREAVGDRPTYITFDVDGLDPAFAPGTGTPVCGGLTTREALALLRGLAGIDLVGADVVEVEPAHDHADCTCLLAANVLFECASLLALKT